MTQQKDAAVTTAKTPFDKAATAYRPYGGGKGLHSDSPSQQAATQECRHPRSPLLVIPADSPFEPFGMN